MGKDSKKRRQRHQERAADNRPTRAPLVAPTTDATPSLARAPLPPASVAPPATTAPQQSRAAQSPTEPDAPTTFAEGHGQRPVARWTTTHAPLAQLPATSPPARIPSDPLAARVFQEYVHWNSPEEIARHTPEETLEYCCQILCQRAELHKANRRNVGARAYNALRDAFCPGLKNERQAQWLEWISGAKDLPFDEFAKFTPPSKIRAGYPDFYREAAGVYKWAESVGLGKGGKESKKLWDAVQAIKLNKSGSYIVTFYTPSGEERTAQARIRDGHVILELIPFPEEEYDDQGLCEAYDEDETDIICARAGGHVVAMFDRSGMKWDTALLALIRDGEIKLSTEQEELLQMGGSLRGHPSWFQLRRASTSELAVWTDAGKPTLKAARAKAGQGKTTAIKAERIRSLAKAVGRGDIDVPGSSLESTRLEKSLTAEYKTRKEKGTLPPTQRQIAYAKDLAARCGIEVSKDALASFKGCSDFIDRYQAIAPPSDRQLQFARQVAGNTPVPDEVLKSTKACSEWIEKMEKSNLEALRRPRAER